MYQSKLSYVEVLRSHKDGQQKIMTRIPSSGQMEGARGFNLEAEPQEIDCQWLEGCFIGELRLISTSNKLKERLRDKDPCKCEVSLIGGRLVLLSNCKVSMVEELVANEDERLLEWFSSIQPWSNTKGKIQTTLKVKVDGDEFCIYVIEEETNYDFKTGTKWSGNNRKLSEDSYQAKTQSYVEDSMEDDSTPQHRSTSMAACCREGGMLGTMEDVVGIVAKKFSRDRGNYDDMPDLA
ncbi:hypothetical protein Ancab_019659 [Ancistrocladus abbreviatus]